MFKLSQRLSNINDVVIMNSLTRNGGGILDALNELMTHYELIHEFKYVYKRGHVTPIKHLMDDYDNQVETIMTLDEIKSLNSLQGRVQSLLYSSVAQSDEDISELLGSALEHDPECQTDAFVHLDTFCVDENTTRFTVELNDGPELYTHVEPSTNLPRIHLDNIMGFIKSFDMHPCSTIVFSNEHILNTFEARLVELKPDILKRLDPIYVNLEDESISFFHGYGDGMLTVTLREDAYTYLDRMLQVVIDWIERTVNEKGKIHDRVPSSSWWWHIESS